MTELTGKVQDCSIHTCNREACNITYTEAQACIELVKQECIDAVMKLPARGDMRRLAIQAIRAVK